MRLKPISIILSLILTIMVLTACRADPDSDIPSPVRLQQIQSEQSPISDIQIIGGNTTVKPGEDASLIIKGDPGLDYRINSTYSIEGRVYNTQQLAKAGEDGKVSWTWNVSENTDPGTYPITISYGDKTFFTSYTVERK